MKKRTLKTRIILQKDNKTIFTFKCKKPRRSKYGELDIMMDAGKKLYFEKVVAGDYFREFDFPKYKIDGVSWHGYFESINERLLNPPIVHFKKGNEKLAKEWHLGSINQEESFAFPLCSVYLPKNINVSDLNTSYYPDSEKINYHIINTDNSCDKRIDIFVTPKGISAKKILDLPLGLFYRFIDIDIFNDKEGNALALHKDDMNQIEIIEDDSGHDILIRTIKNKTESSNFSYLMGTYTLLIHDPNDVYNRMANRTLVTIEEGNNFSVENFKDMYEKEMKKD